jgi:hypothetical protein
MVTSPPERLIPIEATESPTRRRHYQPSLSPTVDDGWIIDGRPLSSSTERALAGLVRGLCPPEPPLENLEDRMASCARRMTAYMHPTTAWGFWFSVHALDWSPIWRLRGWRRIQHLTPEAAATALTELDASRWVIIRSMLVAVRAIILSQFFDQPEVHEAMGYTPVGFTRQRIALRNTRYRGTERQDVMLGHLSPTTRSELP